MDLRSVALLPLRVSIAATQATLGLGQLASQQGPVLREGGYAQRLGAIIAEDGLLDQVARILDDERGPIGLANTLADLTAPDRPLDRLVVLGETFEALVPKLDLQSAAIPNLHTAVALLSGAVEPLGALAGRIPGSRRRGGGLTTPAMTRVEGDLDGA